MIALRNVTGGYDASTAVVHDLSFTVEKGRFFALLGPNGSGKTTIIRLIMDALKLHSGIITIDGKNVQTYKPKELARKVAVMTQENEIGLDFTVEEIVNIGRYPYQKSLLFKENSEHDQSIVKKVMEQTNTWKFRGKSYMNLSGGEKQRVLLAKALAQEPDILLLDEPTNHLDVRHTMELLDLLKQLQITSNITILAILHDLNLASLYADTIGLLSNGRLQETYEGFLKQDEQTFSDVYGVNMKFKTHPVVAKNQIFLSPAFLISSEDSTLKKNVILKPNNEGLELHFVKPLRTLSVGTEGKGMTWSSGWRFINSSSKLEESCADYTCEFEGQLALFAYDHVRNDFVNGTGNEEVKQSWSSFMLMAKEKHTQDHQIAIITNTYFDDIQLMNLAVQLTSLKTELLLQYGNESIKQQSIPLLVLGSFNNLETSTTPTSFEQASNEISQLIQHGVRTVIGLEMRKKVLPKSKGY